MKLGPYPLTAVGVVKKIITEMGVMDITRDGIVLTELAPGLTVEEIQAVTDAKLIVSDHLKVMDA